MFGSKILEVAIGLIFLFMIYSLFASAIQELISSVLVLRARMLRKTIRKMLTDQVSHFQKTKGRNFFYRIFTSIKDFIFFFLHPFIPKFEERHSLATMFYEQPGIKYLAVSNWYKRPSYIKPETFAKTIYDILLDNGKGKDDTEKINNIFETNSLSFENQELSIDSETLSYLKSLWKDSEQNTDNFKTLIVGWYSETMLRLKGLYKRRMRIYLFIIGYLIAITFNVDIIKLSSKLSKDDKVRSDLVQLASTYIETNKDVNKTMVIGDSVVENKDSIAAEINILYKMLKKDLNEPNSLLSIGWSIPDDFERNRISDSLSQLNAKIKNPKYRKRNINVCDECSTNIYVLNKPVKQNQELGIWNKLRYLFCMATNTRSLIGFLITAIGISLGAPFWFDLLQKAIKLRNAGKGKEEESK